MQSRLGQSPAASDDRAYRTAVGALHDGADALQRRGLLTDGVLDPGLAGAIGLLAAPRTALDVDLRMAGVQAKVWQRRDDSAVASLATVDGIVFELGWFATDAWAGEPGAGRGDLGGRPARHLHRPVVRRPAVRARRRRRRGDPGRAGRPAPGARVPAQRIGAGARRRAARRRGGPPADGARPRGPGPAARARRRRVGQHGRHRRRRLLDAARRRLAGLAPAPAGRRAPAGDPGRRAGRPGRRGGPGPGGSTMTDQRSEQQSERPLTAVESADLADKYDQMMRPADLFDDAGAQMRDWAQPGPAGAHRPGGGRVHDALAGHLDDGRGGACAPRPPARTACSDARSSLDADALVLRATVLTYRWIDEPAGGGVPDPGLDRGQGDRLPRAAGQPRRRHRRGRADRDRRPGPGRRCGVPQRAWPRPTPS
ncbi:hypothetical protein G5V59_20255 [Nocardioides sp. W3-2-3]|nr:hypothetical protein [Nocardioides convexus]